ncbi:MAG: CD225/dispanin family protein [Hyphomicrobiales bacterium]
MENQNSGINFQKDYSNQNSNQNPNQGSNMNQNMPQFPPKTWLAESILVTLFCCLPFGIVAIIYAAGVNSKFTIGDYYGALNASKQAGTWVKVGFFCGIAVYVIYTIYVLAFASSITASMMELGNI